MSTSGDRDVKKQLLHRQLFWIGISSAISITLHILFPFYIALPLTIVVFVLVVYYARNREPSRLHRDSYPSLSSLVRSAGRRETAEGVKFYCMSCGTRHNYNSCPSCRSKIKRADF